MHQRADVLSTLTLVVVSLHEPHPKPEIKKYALEIIINHLREEGKI